METTTHCKSYYDLKLDMKFPYQVKVFDFCSLDYDLLYQTFGAPGNTNDSLIAVLKNPHFKWCIRFSRTAPDVCFFRKEEDALLFKLKFT